MSSLGCASPKIVKLIPRLASNYDGEVIATVRAIARTLYGAGKDFHDLACAVQQETAPANAAPPVEPQNWFELCLFCLAFPQLLTAREFAFLRDIAPRLVIGGQPTVKQADWLRAIYSKIKRMSAA